MNSLARQKWENKYHEIKQEINNSFEFPIKFNIDDLVISITQLHPRMRYSIQNNSGLVNYYRMISFTFTCERCKLFYESQEIGARNFKVSQRVIDRIKVYARDLFFSCEESEKLKIHCNNIVTSDYYGPGSHLWYSNFERRW